MYFGRGKNKIKDPYTLKDMYTEYVKEFPEGNIYYVTYREFIDINESFYRRMMDDIMFKGATFKLPFRMGNLKIIKRKINFKNNLAIDWKTTNEIGKKAFHFNDHSSGFKFIFKWSKGNIIVQNKYLYRLVITRKYKRDLARLIKEGRVDYFGE